MKASLCQELRVLIPTLLAIAMAGCGGGSGGNDDTPPIPINKPPTVSIIQPAVNPCCLDVKSAPSLDIAFVPADPDGGSLNYAWTWDAGMVSPSEGTADAGTQVTSTFTPPDCDGTCTLKVSVSDGEASADATLAVQVTGCTGPGTQLRIVSLVMTPDPVAPSATANVTATVENPGGKSLTYTWKSKYGRFTGSGSVVAWEAPANPGVYGLYLMVSDGTDTASCGRAMMVSGPSGGLLGQYFSTYRDKNVVYFKDLLLTRTDPTINFFWEKLSPDPGRIPGDGWGAKWTGYVKCEQPGTYVFRVYVDDGVRMQIQDDTGKWIAVIPNDSNNWTDHTEGAWLPDPTVPIQLDGGKWYPIALDYFEGGGDAFIGLYWSLDGGPEGIIPQEDLKPPS